MLTLGDLMARARAASPAFEAWLADSAPDLAGSVRAAATERDETPAAFARAAVIDFDRHASAEAWTRLTGRLHNSADPGLVCLQEMVRWRLATPLDEPLEEAR